MEELYGEHRLYWVVGVCATCRQTGRSLMAGMPRHIILLSKQPRVLVVLPLPPLSSPSRP
jgi:hypothetical protein